MKSKILIFGIMAAVLLMTLSFVTAVETEKNIGKKESPLYSLRLGKLINKENQNEHLMITYNFLKNFQNRIFFTPFKLSFNRIADNQLGTLGQPATVCAPCK
jgi:hypothetical protein